MNRNHTPAQEVANAALHLAIETAAGAYGMLPERRHLGDWLLVTAIEDLDRPGRADYSMFCPGGGLAPHVARGLVTVAQGLLLVDW